MNMAPVKLVGLAFAYVCLNSISRYREGVYAHALQQDDFGGGPGVMHAYPLTTVDPQAQCNDGSPGVYYLAPGTAEDKNKWVIRFMGGGWCINKADCANRWKNSPFLMSTVGLPDTVDVSTQHSAIPDGVFPNHGILSANPQENPYFGSWNRVHLWYCSSDLHLGEAAAGQDTEIGQWHFMGKRITAAMVEDLLDSQGLDAAEQILVTGDSAGGVAAMNNAAFIYDQIRKRAPHLELFKTLVDAGWFLDIPSFSPSGWFTFRGAAQSLMQNMNATFDSTCEEYYGKDERWRCFHAQYAWPHITIPALYLEFLYDSANLGFDAAGPGDFEPFRAQLVESFAAPPSATALGLNVFAPACNLHESLDNPAFVDLVLEKTRFHPLLVRWFEAGVPVAEVSKHLGVRPPGECWNASAASLQRVTSRKYLQLSELLKESLILA